MTHFPATVVLSPDLLARHTNVEAAVAELMDPYFVNRRIQFVDQEDEFRAEYETGTLAYRRLPDHSLVPFWKSSDTLPEVKIRNSEVFSCLEEYAQVFHGAERDSKTGRYGYWDNPQGHWEWYTIGGTWRGFYPLREGVGVVLGTQGADPKPRHGDIVRVGDLDLDAVAAESERQFEMFRREWPALSRWEESTHFRGWALNTGLLYVTYGPHEARDETELTVPWSRFKPGDTWTDVLWARDLGEVRPALGSINTPIVVDQEGWHQPKAGHMLKFQLEFMNRFILGASCDTTLVLVDVRA